MKHNPTTRRAFALSSLALAAFGLSSFATVAAAEPGKRAAEVTADKKSDEEPAVCAGSYSFRWHEVDKDDLARQLADLKSKCKDILNHKAEFKIFKISGTASNALNHAIAPDGSVMLKEEEQLGDTPDERFYYFYQGAELKLITYYHSMMGREFEKVEFYFDSNELFSSFSQSMRMGETAREVPWKFAALSEERAYYSVQSQSQSLGREFLTRTYKSATGDDKGALREKIDQQAPVTIVRGALTELSEKRMDDLLTSLLKVRKKAKPVDKEDADFYNEQAAFAMP